MDTSRIIRGAVGGGRYTVTAPITQWDYGYIFVPEIEDLPATYRLDFSNEEHHGTALPVYGNAEGAEVPKELIDTGKDIFVWYFFIGDGYGKSAYKWRIPNKCKPKTSEDEPTPSQQSSIDQLISIANEAVDTAQESASEASASAQSASDDADRAEQAKDDASTFAQRSAQSAQASEDYSESASASASASANSASQSAQIKADVEDLVNYAQAAANSSEISARASGESASQAQGFAQSASTSATNARGYASQAQTSAQTASTKASEASTSASTASTKASESAQSATNASQSAQTAEQAKTDAETAQASAEQAKTDAISAKEDAESARDEAQSIVDGISEKVEQIDANTADIASLEEDRYKPYAVDSASGSIASFTDGADDIPLKSLIVTLEPQQDTSQGEPSPENICPISGWTGMQIQHTKKNLLPLNIWNGINYNASVGTVINPTMSDKSWTQNADGISYVTSSTYTNMSLMTSLLPKGTYRLSVHKFSSGTLRYTRYALDKNYTVKMSVYSANITNNSAVVTLDEDGYIAVRLDNGSTASQTVEATIQLEIGDTETAYEPYQWQTIPITFGQTVYGGKLDVLTGKLTVYPYYASYNGETLTGRWISDRDVYAVGTTPTIGAQVVNVGAEGTEYQLEPHEVKSLLGANNIFADTGDSEVEYRADTKLYIKKLTQPEEDDMIADSAITSGQFFMVGNTLYRALANIASGATITVGTNAQRVSLADALNLVNA